MNTGQGRKWQLITGLLMVLVLALCLAFVAPASAGSGTVTVNLLSSTNAGLYGGSVYYYDGGWQLLGTTDASGLVSGAVPKTTDIEIRYAGGKYKWQGVDPAANPTLHINTVLVTVKLETCEGTQLVGDAQYYYGGFTSIGNTPATIELLPYSGLGPGQGSYDFKMAYDGRTSPIHRQDISADPVVVFKTTKVELYGPNVLWYNGGWQPFTSPKEVIGGVSTKPGDSTVAWADFKFNGYSSPTVKLDINGCKLSGGIATLVDEVGAPLANYPTDYPAETRNLKLKYRCGGSWGPTTSFQTDASGQVFYNIDCSTVGSGTGNWDKKITMTLNQTTTEQDVTVNSVFQASKVNVNLNTCNPATPLSGGTVAQGGGYWYTHGLTDSSGTYSFYAFPGKNVKVSMKYNYGSNTQSSVPVVFPETDINFTTTTVNLFGSEVQVGVSGWPQASMPIELLPGTYNFKIDGTRVNGIVISGCEYSGGLLTVKDELGNGVQGATFEPACGGSWYPGLTGTTDSRGKLFTEIPACMTKISAKVGNSSQEQSLAQLNASGFTYTTEVLRVNLKDHAGSAITDQTGTLEQGGGTWIGLGSFNASGYFDVQTFPVGSARYSASYNFTTETKNGIPVTAAAGVQELDFQTGQVNSSCGHTQYQGAGWSTFTSGMELMPGTRTYRYPSQTVALTAGQVLNLCP